MRHFILSLILACGCASSACALSVEQTVGVWKLDTEAFWAEMMKQPEMAAMPEEQLAMVKGMALIPMSKMRFTLTSTGSIMTGAPGGKSEVNVYKSFTSTGDKTASVVAVSNGKEETGTYELAKSDELRITVSKDGTTMTFPLVRSASAATTK